MKNNNDNFYENGYKVVIPYNTALWNQVTIGKWCSKHLEGECICSACPIMDGMISWYFENKEDALVFALRWKNI